MIYDPYAERMQLDPYPVYAHFRDQEPCAYNREMDFYALFRFRDVWQATLDWETYSSSLGPTLENRGEHSAELMSIIGMDPPRHTRLRNLVSRGFTPRRIGELEKQVRDIARSYLEPLAGAGRVDIQREFSVKFPMDVISLLLGIPEADRDHFDRQGYLIVRQALDEAKVARLLEAGDRLLASDLRTGRQQATHGRTDGFRNTIALDDNFIPLIDHPRILPTVVQLLGADLQIMTSHLIHKRPDPPGTPMTHRSPGWGDRRPEPLPRRVVLHLSQLSPSRVRAGNS